MGLYDELIDPQGNRSSRSAADSYGILGLDLGLGLFGNWIGKKVASSTFRMGMASARKYENTFGPILASHTQKLRAGAKADYRTWKRTGKSLSNLGWLAGSISLIDLAIGIGSSLASPTMNRDVSMDQVFNDNELMLDTRTAYTQRQRSLMAIHDSQLSVGRALIGQESQYLHR